MADIAFAWQMFFLQTRANWLASQNYTSGKFAYTKVLH
jgi:hypothetical protein